MRRRLILSTALIAAPLAASAVPARAQGLLDLLAGTGAGATRFVQLVTVGNNFEIQSSQLVLARSTHPQIRDFAQRMVEQHTALNAELSALPEASSRTPAALDDKHTGMLLTLQQQENVDLLNRYYVQQQIEAHEEAVAAYEAYAAQGEVESLKTFAQRHLPMIRQHLETARSLQTPRAG
jgi:putative membrane protein